MTLTSNPKISTYISTFNALFFQSTLEQTIRQALTFSDEIIVSNSSNTSDGTNELLDTLKSEYPNIIKTFTYNEPDIITQETLADRKTFALKKSSKEYCILQDDDECIHEKYATYIRQLPIISPSTIAFRFNTIHFYRSFNHYKTGKNWYQRKIYMVKNIPDIKHGLVGTDPDNHIIKKRNSDAYEPLDLYQSPQIINTPVTSYHYGWANRNDSVLLMKKYFQEIQWHGDDYWNSHKFPFLLENPDTLPKFEETHPKYMTPIIEREKRFNTKYIKEFTED